MVQKPTPGGHRGRRGFFQSLKADLVEAVRVYTRYDLPDSSGDTRRARNERAGEYAPDFIVPEEGQHVWNWFVDLNRSVSRISNGICRMILPSEYIAWRELTGHVVYAHEYDMLKCMDEAYCIETNLEFESLRTKQQEQQKADMEAARGKTRRR